MGKYIKQNKLNESGTFWQRNYYQHVIRDEKELNLVREYIINNPLQWSFYGDNPEHIYNREYLEKWRWPEKWKT
jgi:putative transposase